MEVFLGAAHVTIQYFDGPSWIDFNRPVLMLLCKVPRAPSHKPNQDCQWYENGIERLRMVLLLP